MAVRTMEELLSAISARLGEDMSDEALGLLEDVTDTFTDYETRASGESGWKEKYEQNDREWRERYRNRFMSGTTETVLEVEDVKEEVDNEMTTFEELFTTERSE